MDYKKVDEIIKRVEKETNEKVFYAYAKHLHAICDNDGIAITYKDKVLTADTFEKLVEKAKAKTYKIGDRFLTQKGVELMLCQVSASICCLIKLKTGNRMLNAVIVNDVSKITQEELDRMFLTTRTQLQLVDNQRSKV